MNLSSNGKKKLHAGKRKQSENEIEKERDIILKFILTGNAFAIEGI
jgi:hypothetical protein